MCARVAWSLCSVLGAGGGTDWGLAEFYHPGREYNVRVASRYFKVTGEVACEGKGKGSSRQGESGGWLALLPCCFMPHALPAGMH